MTVRLRAPLGDDVRGRSFLANSSCGICGKAALEEVEVRCGPVAPGPTVAAATISALPEQLAQHQRVFGQTGGLHAAARFTPDGTLLAVREDVGRHNALDKLIGHTLLEGELPLAGEVLLVSGRLSFELVQKAAVAGLAVLCAVSAPSSLAIAAAERFGQTVVAFVRDGRFNVYTQPRTHRSGRLMARRNRGRDLVKSKHGMQRGHWVGWKLNGIGEQKPRHYASIVRTIVDNRRSLPWAWRILRKGVCDGCALGVAGFHDWTISGVHLCTTRLDLLKVNTATAIDETCLADVESLAREHDGRALRELGRLAHPMVRHKGERGFARVSWDTALDLIAGRIRDTRPDRVGIYLTARGLTNEVYYTAQKAARFLGTNNIDNAARVCHAPSTVALKETLGVGATTCSYRDVIDSDLIVLFGADVANAQPVFMKYLFLAKQRGAKVAVVNPFREPGLERYWVPSNIESALFGTKVTDEFFSIHTGGDAAFVNGVLKHLLAIGAVDRRFVTAHTLGFDGLLAELEDEPFDALERSAGASRADMARFAEMYAAAGAAVLVWSMGVTQHESGVDNVRAIINLALARANVGRPGAGVMPIRGHSGVQGGAEMGAYSTAFPGGVAVNAATAAALSAQWGFDVPVAPGLMAAEMVDAARRGDLDVLWSSGGNFLDVLPAPEVTRAALGAHPTARAPGCRAHRADARGAGRHGRVAPRRDALRTGRRRHVDHDGASRRVQSRAPRSSRRRSAQRVADLRRGRAPGASRARRPLRLRVGRRDPRGDRARRAVVRGDRTPAHDGRRHPGRRPAPLRGRRVPHGRRPGPVQRGRTPHPRRSRGAVRALDPPGQAVQHDGLERRRPAHGRRARRGVRGRGRRRGARSRGRRRGRGAIAAR